MKNLFVFAPVLFSGQAHSFAKLLTVAPMFLAVTLVASSVYVFNDILDVETDRRHPAKKRRPIPSGQISVGFALWESAMLAGLGLALALVVSHDAFPWVVSYLAVNLLYTWKLKHLSLVDVTCVAYGYMARIIIGSIILALPISYWMLSCVFLLALYITLHKRRAEIEGSATTTRPVLAQYSKDMLQRGIGLCGGAAVALYIFFAMTQVGPKHDLILTIPLVVLGFLRFEQLADATGGEAPDRKIPLDPVLVGILVLWAAVAWATIK